VVIRSILDVRDKQHLTQKLVNLLPENGRISVESALPVWWYNLRKNGGLRLTTTGFQTFVNDLELEHYEYAVENPQLFNQQTILDLDRKLQMPYYIHVVKGIPKKIVFFGSREAVVINLYSNLQQFLDNYKP
jgi:hypothetical protein